MDDAQLALVGTWRLLRVRATAGGEVDEHPFGAEPRGRLVYTAAGEMAAMISYGGRTPLSGDRMSAPLQERAEAFATFFAYAGRYSVDANRVVHHVDVASVENWVGTDLVRIVEHNGEMLTLRTPPTAVGGETRITELRWERVAKGASR